MNGNKFYFSLNIIVVCGIISIMSFPSFVGAAEAMTPDEVKAALDQKRETIIMLDKEKEVLIQEAAAPELIANKTKEIMQVRQEALELFEKLKPQSPSASVNEIAPEEAKEMEMLIQERRQKIAEGAGREEVSHLTQVIQSRHISIVNKYRQSHTQSHPEGHSHEASH